MNRKCCQQSRKQGTHLWTCNYLHYHRAASQKRLCKHDSLHLHSAAPHKRPCARDSLHYHRAAFKYLCGLQILSTKVRLYRWMATHISWPKLPHLRNPTMIIYYSLHHVAPVQNEKSIPESVALSQSTVSVYKHPHLKSRQEVRKVHQQASNFSLLLQLFTQRRKKSQSHCLASSGQILHLTTSALAKGPNIIKD